MTTNSSESEVSPWQLIRGFLEESNPYRNTSDKVPDILEFGLALDKFALHVVRDIFVHELEAVHSYERLLAAYFLLEVYKLGEHSKRALDLFRDALTSPDPELVEMALYCARGFSHVPQELTAFFRKLLTHQKPAVRLQAALIGVQHEELRSQCEKVIVAGMDSEDPAIKLESALAAIRGTVNTRQAWNTVMTMQNLDDKASYFETVFLLIGTRKLSSEATPHLLILLNDGELKIATRCLIARLLAMTEPESSDVQTELVEMMKVANWRLVYAAADALVQQTLDFPEEGIDALLNSLSSPKRRVREAAAVSLFRCCPALDSPRLERVVKLMVVERDMEVFGSLMEICMAGGDRALPPLLAAMVKVSHLRQLMFFVTLTQMGPASCTELVRFFATVNDPDSMRFFAGLLASSRLENSELIPQLRAMIVGEDVDESKLALLAIANAGESIAHLTPDLLQIANGQDRERADLAEQVVEGIGPAALAYFGPVEEHAGDSKVGKLRARIESLGNLKGLHELSWFDDLVSLRVFVLLAEEIEAKGGASRVEIQRSLEAKQGKGLVSNNLPVSRPSLKRHTGFVEDKLEARWGRTVRLLEERKKKYYLTVEGRKFLRKAKSYLLSLSRQ